MDLHLASAIALGIVLDLVLGDPIRMPHIVRLAGSLTNRAEDLLVKFCGRTLTSGIILWILLVGGFLFAYFSIAAILAAISPWLKVLFDGLIIFQCLAFKDLAKHVRLVKTALAKDLPSARKRVSYIVGRDTDQMDKSDVCRAAIESGSENLNDAVIAPLFWLFILGPAGALLFRIANTLDAIVGHRNERFELLGKASARIDDALNFIPARLCALFILPLKTTASWRKLKPDAIKHPSINAGWPEAAMAHRLDVVIGGRMYDKGKLVQTAEMNEGKRQPTPTDIDRCIRIMGTTYTKAIICFTLFVWLLHLTR